MSTQSSTVPRVQTAAVSGPMQLTIRFENGVEKSYDLQQLAEYERFVPLFRDPSFVKSVQVDPGGYGVSWNENMDLSEYELWTHGVANDL
jgi:hypothetical protein